MPLMEKLPPQTLGLLLHDAAQLLRRRFEDRGRELGLPSAQWRLLVRLLREGRAPQVRLAELLEIEPISVSRLVDRMVEAGWVDREKDATDRRINIVVPTPRAQQLFQELRVMAEQVYDQALQGVSAEERTVLVSTLGRIVANLSAPEPAENAQPRYARTR